MKFEARYQPEACVMSTYQGRPHMEHVWFDADRKRLLATNGHLAIVVPCEVEDDDVSGFVPVAAIEFARNKRDPDDLRPETIELHCREHIECEGATFERPKPEKEFPPVDQASAKGRRGDPQTVTFAVDARYLYKLACALGGGEVDSGVHVNVLITIKHTDGGDQAVEAMHVEALDAGVATASLMPCRLPEKPSTLVVVP